MPVFIGDSGSPLEVGGSVVLLYFGSPLVIDDLFAGKMRCGLGGTNVVQLIFSCER